MITNPSITQHALKHIQQLEWVYGDAIPWNVIELGFEYNNEKILIANKARGIFKPKQMTRGLLSIKTTIPRKGRVNIYNDKEDDNGFFRYSLQRGDPKSGGNKHLWEALEDSTPFIYFYPIAPAVYNAIWPCFVKNIHPHDNYAEITVGSEIPAPSESNQHWYAPKDIETRYIVRETKIRLHQASFREAVLFAYDKKCAITGLPSPKLLEAAHIIPDQLIGEKQSVTNGIALSRLHHKAYDVNLIGIDPDYKIHVSDELRLGNSNKFLKVGILDFEGRDITLPKNIGMCPNKDYLARRFEDYERHNR